MATLSSETGIPSWPIVFTLRAVSRGAGGGAPPALETAGEQRAAERVPQGQRDGQLARAQIHPWQRVAHVAGAGAKVVKAAEAQVAVRVAAARARVAG